MAALHGAVSGKVRGASGLDGEAEGSSHGDRVGRGGDACVHEAGGRAHLHGFAGLRGAAYASIDYHGQFGILDEYAQHFYRKLGYETIGGFTPFGDPYELILAKKI